MASGGNHRGGGAPFEDCPCPVFSQQLATSHANAPSIPVQSQSKAANERRQQHEHRLFRRAELSYKEKALTGLFAPVVTACFLLSDYLTMLNPACRWIPALMLAFSWGIINSVGSEVTGTLIFVVTGAMTRFSNMIVDRISRTAGRKKIPKEGLMMTLSVIGGFWLGAGWSVWLNKNAPQLTKYGVFSIMGGIYGSLFLYLDREQLGAWWSRKNGKLCEIDGDEVNCAEPEQ
eukprot:scaffold1804_cov134-Skeletonema_marinoi.AAC.10